MKRKVLSLLGVILVSGSMLLGCSKVTITIDPNDETILSVNKENNKNEDSSESQDDNTEKIDDEAEQIENNQSDIDSSADNSKNEVAASDNVSSDSIVDSIAYTDEPNANTGDASLDNPRNQDEIGLKEVLVVSLGNYYNDNRRLSIGAIEDAVDNKFSDYEVRRAFLSENAINTLNELDGVKIDSLKEAMDRAVDNGVKWLVIQPNMLTKGSLYQSVVKEVNNYSNEILHIAVAEPLFTTDNDFSIAMNAIVNSSNQYSDGQTAIVFMGHICDGEEDDFYSKMEKTLRDGGRSNYYVGAVGTSRDANAILDELKPTDYTKVVLIPLMLSAGDEAYMDIASDADSSVKSVFEKKGYEVTCDIKGLGSISEIMNQVCEHVHQAMNTMN